MRFVTYVTDGAAPRAGIVVDDGIRPLLHDGPLIDLLGDGLGPLLSAGEAASSDAIPMGQVRLLAPVTPPQMRDSMCFHEHIRNAQGTDQIDERHSQFPTFYFSNAMAVLDRRTTCTSHPAASSSTMNSRSPR